MCQQPRAVLGEDRRVEAAFLQVHVQESAAGQVVLEFLAEGALAAHRVQGDQQGGLPLPRRPRLWFQGIRSSGPRWPACCVGGWDDRVSGIPPLPRGPNLIDSVFQQPAKVRGPFGCSLNPIMIANAGAGYCHVLGSIRSRPCTGLWRNGSSAGRNKGREMQRCAAACGVAHAAVGRDGGGPAGSGPYRPDHGCVGLAIAPRGYILDLSKEDGWPHDHPVYRSHTR